MNWIVPAATLLFAASTAAQTVWRCGADANVYSHSPCAEGRIVAVADERSDEQVAQGHAVLARDKALARDMVRERHARERELALRGPGLNGIKPLPAPKEVRKTQVAQRPKPLRHRPGARGTSRATGPWSR
ncbi:MAG: hypothetical protein KGL43_20710 [Burkholderiales bacterium]|nr:hypothetical protein [Burkholderiales bacterium]MDE2396844.1 hypothetical protein [Burkholderiales bacterium]MDE2456016.1 hypothetical protein [Burkholderiales bacterium]